MTHELPQSNPNNRETQKPDNDRKFILESLNPEDVADGAVTAYDMEVYFIEIEPGRETKIVRKIYADGSVKTLKITKVTVNDERTTDKVEIDDEEPESLAQRAVKHFEKRRHEFTYTQGGNTFNLKYDDYADVPLYMLEVGADDQMQIPTFVAQDFPATLTEVSDDKRYSGHRITEVLLPSDSA